MFCPHCGSQVRNTAAFCGKCGAVIVAPSGKHNFADLSWQRLTTGCIVAIAIAIGFYVFPHFELGTLPHGHGSSGDPITIEPSAEPTASEDPDPAQLDIAVQQNALDPTQTVREPLAVVTSKDPKPFTITRVVLNNRVNVAGCDQSVAMNVVVCESVKATMTGGTDDCSNDPNSETNHGMTYKECEQDRSFWINLDCKDKGQQQKVQQNGAMHIFAETTLSTGDSADYRAEGTCGDSVVMVDIYTDRESGGRRYTFH